MLTAKYDGISYYTNDPAFQWHINNGRCEPYGGGQLDFVKKYLEKFPLKNRTCIDIGAHQGTTMLPYSKLFKNVFGYEPNKTSFDICLKNLELNSSKNCSVKNNAVLDRIITGVSIMHAGGNSGCYYFKEDASSSVSSIILDKENIVDVDFMKIDTEGSELYVLKGAKELITKYKPLLQVELIGLSERHFGIKSSETIDFLDKIGYKQMDNTEFFQHLDTLN